MRAPASANCISTPAWGVTENPRCSTTRSSPRDHPPLYVIGTEVPVPGGALEVIDHLEVTRPCAAQRTMEVHRAAFEQAGLAAAFERVIGLVVQPGVEFGHQNVIVYRPERAR